MIQMESKWLFNFSFLTFLSVSYHREQRAFLCGQKYRRACVHILTTALLQLNVLAAFSDRDWTAYTSQTRILRLSPKSRILGGRKFFGTKWKVVKTAGGAASATSRPCLNKQNNKATH